MDSIRSILVVVLVVPLFHSSLSVKDSNSRLRGGNEMLRENEDIPSDFLPDLSKELTAGNFHNINCKMKIVGVYIDNMTIIHRFLITIIFTFTLIF